MESINESLKNIAKVKERLTDMRNSEVIPYEFLYKELTECIILLEEAEEVLVK